MDLSILSDLHKDARGFRPSGDYTKWFDALPLYAKAKEWDRLTEEVKQREIDRGILETINTLLMLMIPPDFITQKQEPDKAPKKKKTRKKKVPALL